MVTIMNGVVNYDGVTPDSTAQLMCDDGYVPGGDSGDRVCMSDGNWSGVTQTCTVPSKTIFIQCAVLACYIVKWVNMFC